MSPPMAVTEDTPADMLAGSMNLHIVLPSGHVVRTSVLRSTPMMDLLVQITTAHRLSPGSHSLRAMGERGELPFKPSTPIGALDTFTVKIVQKKSGSLLKRAPQIPDVLPHTFRLQVHLPRGQLFVMRVTPLIHVRDVLTQVCREKDLDPAKYELRKTGAMNQQLGLDNTLGEVQTQELTLVVRGADPINPLSSADIMHVKQANNRDKSVCDSSLSSGSLGSRSASPVVATAPQPPTRKKRRPAPKPPENFTRSVVISHSRESSDSSGYHEPSTLSESPTHNGPASDISSGLARNSASMSNLTNIGDNTRLKSSVSVTSLSSNGKKKRAAPPPPPAPPVKTAPIPPPPVELAPSPPATPDLHPPTPLPRLYTSPKPSPRLKLTKQTSVDDDLESIALPDLPQKSQQLTDEPESLAVEWEYQLPPPPTHFRDTDSLTDIYEDPVEDKVAEVEKILIRKSEVMTELTNVLSRPRTREKSQSIADLYLINNAPIANFTISNYEPRIAKTAEDVEFKKPALPAKKVRRADSMNVKRISVDKNTLQQEFLEFLKQRDIPLEFEDVSEILPENVVVENTKDVVVDVKVKEVEEDVTLRLVKEDEPKIRPVEDSVKFVDVKVKKESVLFKKPAISMGTWGERPKTKITIKDDDYTTEVIVPEKRTAEIIPKPLVQLKPVERKMVAKKIPSNYAMFSSLSRKIDSDDETDKQPPVICGVELKKEFRSEPDLIQGLQTERTAQQLAKARLGLMPVVKGFRDFKPEPIVKQQSLPETATVTKSPLKRQESLPPPPPPPPAFVALKPIVRQPVKLSQDPRGELLEQIRAFGGLNRLRKTAQ